mmetsp:Transcript_41785/g.69795  ORF Transcript_41785/g.69795 Transcript_41785/m.69795 type:complete len:174 (-) Transcript_41785:38-559(-)
MSNPNKMPNILVTGTPGTGKTTTAQQIAEQTGLTYINVGDWVKQKELHDGWDEEFECYTMDEDKIVDAMEDDMTAGGQIVDYHSCEFFPERWFDLVIVLRCANNVLYDRLQARGYSEKKLQENMECEIMQVVLEEARESYKHEIVHERQSNSVEEMELNVEQMVGWINQQKTR